MSRKPVFALIIGIDQYSPPMTRLSGAVNDARAFRDFLLTPYEQRGLQVDPSNIIYLEDKSATRTKILSAFRDHFTNNVKIPNEGNAAMIFFFAGHGFRAESPGNHLAVDGKVEVICPVDHATTIAGKYVHGIPDYVLGWLLRDLAKKKGSNITVILDSCHAGGMGRDVGTPRTPPRSVLLSEQHIPPTLDSDLWKGKLDESYHIWFPPSSSHVLLAACHQQETAWEIPYGDGMNRKFRALIVDNPTYEQVIDDLPTWSGQNPHCGGRRRNQMIFNGEYPATGQHGIELQSVQTSMADGRPAYRVWMGSVEGVVHGTEFSIHARDDSFLCMLVADSVQINETILVKRDQDDMMIPAGARAKVSNWKNDPMILQVHVPDDFTHKTDLFVKKQDPSERCSFVEAASSDKAAIILRNIGNEIIVERLTSTIMECARATRFTLHDAAHLPTVVNGITHFNYFLERQHGSNPIMGFSLGMYRLRGEFPTRKPDDTIGNMIRRPEDEAKLIPEADAEYGFIISNTSGEDLFPYLFYFNTLDYTIQCWYFPEDKRVPPLKANGKEVRIGMGGEPPFEFGLLPGKTSSSGFLKLFVSTHYLDLDWIEQETSPFDQAFTGTGRLTGKCVKLQKMPKWDALKVKLTMTSKP
ncbi:hypothetical protein C8J57DRAFT_1726371 [Mycena rebaudengoi]|nr:hypothetical protein C8J57DRAFT_1726371 [Mycena rebaudengoi]